MNFTQIFILVILGIITIVDIILCVKRWPTVSREMKKWYHRLPMVPFCVGVIFIGHFTQMFGIIPWSEALKLTMLGLCSASWIAWSIAMRVKPISFTRKTFEWVCEHPIVPIILGSVVGAAFWSIH